MRREQEGRCDPELIKRVENIEVREGFPPEEILGEAADADCNLIVMGTRGEGALTNTFVGSVVRRVLRRTRRPVLVVLRPKGAASASRAEADM
jgi:nucleotide-binding universal stress UspA family protein